VEVDIDMGSVTEKTCTVLILAEKTWRYQIFFENAVYPMQQGVQENIGALLKLATTPPGTIRELLAAQAPGSPGVPGSRLSSEAGHPGCWLCKGSTGSLEGRAQLVTPSFDLCQDSAAQSTAPGCPGSLSQR
jgi:hypothetical protein